MRLYQSFLALLGRICMGILFFWAGWEKLMNLEGTMGYMASRQMPMVHFFLPAAIALQIVGSLSLITGYKARWGAALLILFIIPAAMIFHDFWNLQGQERYIEKIMFMKDVAILGGLMMVVAFGPGKWSVDRN